MADLERQLAARDRRLAEPPAKQPWWEAPRLAFKPWHWWERLLSVDPDDSSFSFPTWLGLTLLGYVACFMLTPVMFPIGLVEDVARVIARKAARARG